MTDIAKIKAEKLAVLYGGDSAEREVSLSSGKAVADALQRAGFNVVAIDTLNYDLHQLKEQGVKRAFIALHGRGGEDGCIQGALEYLQIPYTGSGVLGSALSMDKGRSKQIFSALGLPTASYQLVDKHSFEATQVEFLLAGLGGKAMVKPAHEGSSIGMAIAETPQQLEQALQQAFTFDPLVLVEAWIDGPEYTVAILGEQALPAIRMETPNTFYDYQAKYQSNTTLYHCPCGLSEADEKSLQALALKAFKAVDASGWGRVDVMRNSDGQWQLLEVNTVPGMTETSLVPKAARATGMNFEQLVEQIVLLTAKES
jgi:D-alanine-D-alanine ligase